MTPLDPLAIGLEGVNLIEASAGTGKTYTIATLVVRLLLERQLDISKILVVTYTNAATAELRTRVRRRLRQAADALAGHAPPADETLAMLLSNRTDAQRATDRLRLAAALYNFDDAAIFTIHGFCQRMLLENAFESGAAFDAELVPDQTRLREQIVSDFWVRELYSAPIDQVQAICEQTKPLDHLTRLVRLVGEHPRIPVLPSPDMPPLGTDSDVEWLRFRLRCMTYARHELRRRKDETHTQSFDDLLHRLNDALAGPSGAALARRIEARFGAVLIDEFQDTDPVQYEVFRRVYLGSAVPLFLIGDPKQAIFAFRGADVFAYLRARQDAHGRHHHLTTNRRSDRRLVEAVSSLFERVRRPFIFDEIEFSPVAAAADGGDALQEQGKPAAPFRILFVRRTAPKSITIPWARRQLPALLAGHIVQLLRSEIRIGANAIQPADVAVLCNTNEYARLMQQSLRALGVPTALLGDANVFDSEEAADLERVLRAMAEPANGVALRAALATVLMGVNAEGLLALQENEAAWDAWAERFQAWHDIWTRYGFMPAFRSMLEEQGLQPTLLGLIDGERRLTNVLHLAELLHVAAAQERRGPLALVDWLGQMRVDPLAQEGFAPDATQIRLETDSKALKLVTIHKSKGLEYPVVVCPQLWHVPQADDLVRFHNRDDGDRLTLDLGSRDLTVHKRQAEREMLAERLRLLYVALTRAQHLCIVVWGRFSKGESSALGYLLHQPAGADGADAPALGASARIKSADDAALLDDLEGLSDAAGGTIAVEELVRTTPPAYRDEVTAPRSLIHREVTRVPNAAWRTSSFSGLIAQAAPVSAIAAEGVDRDERVGEEEPLQDASECVDPIALADFPSGTRAGQLIHDILEDIDFPTATFETLRTVAQVRLEQYGFETRWAQPLAEALLEVIDTPLGDDGCAPRLRQITAARRLNEMEFVFPVGGRSASDERDTLQVFTAARLAGVFEAHAQSSVAGGYLARLRGLGFAPLAGYLKGFIDLVFEHGGRWYVVDYKSNRLGAAPSDYGAPQMQTAMEWHHYFLQYHLYVVALHRYLSQRLEGYDYDRHFGGVFYLFVRGMSPRRPGAGVFSDRPARGLIEALSELLRAPHSGAPA